MEKFDFENSRAINLKKKSFFSIKTNFESVIELKQV